MPSKSYLLVLLQSGHTCGGDVDLWKGQPLGALRASFGYMSVEEDVTALIKFLKDCFVTVSSLTYIPYMPKTILS